MFPPPRPSSPRHRSASCSTDDQSSTKDRPRRLFQRYFTHDHSISSHSLATTHSHHDDLPTPSFPPHTSHATSTQSTPMTSPSTGYSSLFPGSLSSTTSESVPSVESKYRSEFGMLMFRSSPYSALHESPSSRSFHPLSPWSGSPTESDSRVSASQIPHKRLPGHPLDRPSTAPSSPPVLATASPTDHIRSHSRLTVSIKNLFSRHAIPSPSRFSFNSATASTPPDNEAPSTLFHASTATGKQSMTPQKSRPPDLEISDAHRRYASEAAAKLYNSKTGNGLPTNQESIDVPFRNVPPVRGRDPKTRNVLRRRPSGSAKHFKGRERGMSSPSHPNDGNADRVRVSPIDNMSRQDEVPFPLTPAGAVVEAYKQQELHREGTPSPPKLSIDDRMGSTVSHDSRHNHEHPAYSPTPYYTVFGTSSEHRILVGGPDDRWAKLEADQRIFSPSQPTLSHQPSMSDPGGRSLARKLSNRWRRVKGGGVVSEEVPSHGKGHSKGRPSLQEVWGDNKSSPRPAGRFTDDPSNREDGAWASPNANHRRSASKGDKDEGPKFWQLMRRISTGGLRDRYQSDKAVPPVPALPKDLLRKVNQVECNNGPFSTPRHQLPYSSHDKGWPSMSLGNIAITRPSMATSSSPNSSDVASSQFFQKSHSPRSSVSSYGEAVAPRAPETILDRRIITPLEQLRLADDHVESGEPSTSSLPGSRSPRRSTSVPTGLGKTENTEADHLSSPHRQICPGELSSSASSRPCSASPSSTGSARASYQNSGIALGQSRMADGIVSLSPPPRPSRNSTRVGSGSAATSPSSSQSIVVKQVDGGVGVRQIDRMPSGQSDMTLRLDSPEPARSRRREQDRNRDASSQVRTQPTFRELNAPRRPPLSEREKADIWNDLLARSDKAGGTLHINSAAELMSDSMRLSTHSEV